MPEEQKRTRNYDKSPEGIAYRRKYNEEHYAHIGLYLDRDLKDRIDSFTAAQHISRNQFAVDAFTAYLNEKQKDG